MKRKAAWYRSQSSNNNMSWRHNHQFNIIKGSRRFYKPPPGRGPAQEHWQIKRTRDKHPNLWGMRSSFAMKWRRTMTKMADWNRQRKAKALTSARWTKGPWDHNLSNMITRYT